MPVIRAAKVVILDKEGNVLLLRRSDTHPRHPLHLDLPGGIVEEGESFEEGVVREVKEETGLTIDPLNLKLIYTVSHDYFGKPISRQLFAVRITKVRPSVTISWEHVEANWVTLAELKGLEEPYQTGIDFAQEHNLWQEV